MRADNEHRTVSSSTTRSSTCASKRRTTVVALSQLLVVVVAAVVWTVDVVVDAYPVIVQVDEGSQRCFRFNIPEDDEYVDTYVRMDAIVCFICFCKCLFVCEKYC